MSLPTSNSFCLITLHNVKWYEGGWKGHTDKRSIILIALDKEWLIWVEGEVKKRMENDYRLQYFEELSSGLVSKQDTCIYLWKEVKTSYLQISNLILPININCWSIHHCGKKKTFNIQTTACIFFIIIFVVNFDMLWKYYSSLLNKRPCCLHHLRLVLYNAKIFHFCFAKVGACKPHVRQRDCRI